MCVCFSYWALFGWWGALCCLIFAFVWLNLATEIYLKWFCCFWPCSVWFCWILIGWWLSHSFAHWAHWVKLAQLISIYLLVNWNLIVVVCTGYIFLRHYLFSTNSKYSISGRSYLNKTLFRSPYINKNSK